MPHLTQREAQCVRLTMQGLSAKAIAEHLGLSARTVEFYLDNVKTKLSCQSKAELVARVMALGLLDVL